MDVEKKPLEDNKRESISSTNCISLKTHIKKTYRSSTRNEAVVSLEGKFGWTTIAGVHIPYIYRFDGRYCSVRILENSMAKPYEQLYHRYVPICVALNCFEMTKQEADLFNEINFAHCDGKICSVQLRSSDTVMKLEDVQQLYIFLNSCYQKIVGGKSETRKKCGFIKINKESPVPYVVINNTTYLPLFYFEGEVDDVKPRSMQVSGWDLAYVKFCCLIQGIKTIYFTGDVWDLVSLELIKQYFPKETIFEDYWPDKIMNELISPPAQKVVELLPYPKRQVEIVQLQHIRTIPANLSNILKL